MALIEELLKELQTARQIESFRVAGGEDLLDTASGDSSLSPEAVEVVKLKWNYEVIQLNRIRTAIAALESLREHGYPTRKVFNVSESIASELLQKQRHMQDFANELLPIVLGADVATITAI